MREIRFDLNLSPKEILPYYRGTTPYIQVRAHNGQRIRFASRHLRPFLSHQGVRGTFCLRFDANNRLIELRQVD